jgi:uncharacterized Zn finger protein
MSTTNEYFGTTWWGRLWITALEQLGDDFENRLVRGKSYAEEGAVSCFTVNPGEIQAKVHGRKTYNVMLGLPALTATQWEKAIERIRQESRFVASLLAGEMPSGLDETFREAGASLYPRVPKELQTHCDCPDWANPCKHVAAVCYVMAKVLDRDPWLLFDLRGRTKEKILEALQVNYAEPEICTIKPSYKVTGTGYVHKITSVADLLPRRREITESWFRMSDDEYDSSPVPLPDITLPRSIPADPSVFTQLGPLPHAKIEVSLCLAALLHRAAKIIKLQIEDGINDMENSELASDNTPSPFATPTSIPSMSRTRRHNKKRRWNRS